MRYYELTIVSKNLSDSERIISLLQIQPIKEQRDSNFFAWEFYAEPEKIEEIEKKIKSEPQVTKYLILKKEPSRTKIEPSPAPSSKVELQEIDKKLKEIFGE